MRIELDAPVTTTDGKDVGKIDKLILNPSTGEVTSVVIRKGFLLPRDVEVPVESLQTGPQGTVRLNCTENELENLPPFIEANYTAPPVGQTVPYGYPDAGLLWPAGWGVGAPIPPAGYYNTAPMDEREAEMLRREDLENAVIDEGSDVMSRDGEKVGTLHSIAFDAETGRPTSFVVRKGFLFHEDFELPANVIDSVDDGQIFLKLTKHELEARPAKSHR